MGGNTADFDEQIWDILRRSPDGVTRPEVQRRMNLSNDLDYADLSAQALEKRVNRGLARLLNNPTKGLRRYKEDGKTELDEDETQGKMVIWRATGATGLTENQEAIILLTAKQLSNAFLSPDERKWFDQHYEHLKKKSSPGFKRVDAWTNKLEIRSRYPEIYPNRAPGSSRSEGIIYGALAQGRGFDAMYDFDIKASTYFPVRMQKREGVNYILCVKSDAPKLKAFALHRFKNIVDTNQKSPNKQSFCAADIKKHVTPGVTGSWRLVKSMKLRITGPSVNHFLSMRFHKDPDDSHKTTHTRYDDKGVSVAFITIQDIEYDYDLHSWMLGMGMYLEVLEPSDIRSKIAAELKAAASKYL